ncbi:MAG: hypothetical protein OEY18_07725 [Candidatus Aminicenantes bacterium]|nr:hypothetical protein [Candidatus Aminicenantes bacterium]MDH5384578.1 hypothetical protein [Candidatus Aminicenantes bacterium]MDH5742250.1 hypothetical protein [Candidatus Aminicenantes bacterium]
MIGIMKPCPPPQKGQNKLKGSIGLSSKLRILLVSYTVKEEKDEDIIRIISSRKATKNEQKIYLERLI